MLLRAKNIDKVEFEENKNNKNHGFVIFTMFQTLPGLNTPEYMTERVKASRTQYQNVKRQFMSGQEFVEVD